MSHSKAHDALFAPICKYLHHQWGFSDQLVEPAKRMFAEGVEVPDVCAWDKWMQSIVVDAKVRVPDFQEQLGKNHVQYPAQGMGSWRYIATTFELWNNERLPMPDYWGLLVVHGDGSIVHMTPAMHWPDHARNIPAEMDLLRRAWKAAEQGRTLGQGNGQSNGSSGSKIPRQLWTEIYNEVHDNGALAIREACRIVRHRSSVAKTRIADYLRQEAEGNGMAVREYGQIEYLELAETE